MVMAENLLGNVGEIFRPISGQGCSVSKVEYTPTWRPVLDARGMTFAHPTARESWNVVSSPGCMSFPFVAASVECGSTDLSREAQGVADTGPKGACVQNDLALIAGRSIKRRL